MSWRGHSPRTHTHANHVRSIDNAHLSWLSHSKPPSHSTSLPPYKDLAFPELKQQCMQLWTAFPAPPTKPKTAHQLFFCSINTSKLPPILESLGLSQFSTCVSAIGLSHLPTCRPADLPTWPPAPGRSRAGPSATAHRPFLLPPDADRPNMSSLTVVLKRVDRIYRPGVRSGS